MHILQALMLYSVVTLYLTLTINTNATCMQCIVLLPHTLLGIRVMSVCALTVVSLMHSCFIVYTHDVNIISMLSYRVDARYIELLCCTLCCYTILILPCLIRGLI